jgi:hypothetical protein
MSLVVGIPSLDALNQLLMAIRTGFESIQPLKLAV